MTSDRVGTNMLCIVFFLAGVLPAPAGKAFAQEKPELPVVDARLGSCKATFTVREGQKPLYNAKVEVLVRSGAFGLRKTELQVGTNTEGKGRVEGLPERTKKPLQFVIRYGALSKTIEASPSDKCDATFDVDLGAK